MMSDFGYRVLESPKAGERVNTDALTDAYNEMYVSLCKKLNLEVDCGKHEVSICVAARLLKLQVSTIIGYKSSKFERASNPGVVLLADVAAWEVVRRPIYRPFLVQIDEVDR